jgi:hypothetical protein
LAAGHKDNYRALPAKTLVLLDLDSLIDIRNNILPPVRTDPELRPLVQISRVSGQSFLAAELELDLLSVMSTAMRDAMTDQRPGDEFTGPAHA